MSWISTSELLGLSGKTALVTGAARGIGEAIAIRLADAGASVVATDIAADAVAAVVDRITAGGGRAVAIAADLSSAEDRRRLVREAEERMGGVDILVNNAGLRDWFTWRTLDEPNWDRFMTVNLKAPFFLTQSVAESMIARGAPGSIVNIVSTAAAQPVPWKIDYNAAKAGLAQMSRSLARELGEYLIRVNAVGPGGTRTEGGSGSLTSSRGVDPALLRKMSESHRERMALPIGLIEPDEIARAVLFFASDASRNVTGQVLYVDGGFLVG